MRIPVNSCIGCNQSIPMDITGNHYIDGSMIACPFVREELRQENLIFLGAFEHKKEAIRKGKREQGCLIWIGQGPHDIWLVVKERT